MYQTVKNPYKKFEVNTRIPELRYCDLCCFNQKNQKNCQDTYPASQNICFCFTIAIIIIQKIQVYAKYFYQNQ